MDPVPAASAPADAPKRRNRGNIRKRAVDEEGTPAAAGANDDDGRAVRASKQARADPNVFTTRKEEKEDLLLKYQGGQTLVRTRDELATGTLETETQFDRDGRALREQVLAQTAAEGGGPGDGKYRGMNAYTDFRAGFRREHTIASEKGTGSHGPLRANVYTRVTARFDYQPDVCKDYKETGFCSYGDSCKFVHDRGDYKSGWELEKEWEADQKRKLDAMTKGWNPGGEDGAEGGESEDDDNDDNLPFACFVCRRNWEDMKDTPVVTRCKHYFCEGCALKGNAKSGKCAVCGQATAGIFNVANDVVKRLKQQREKGKAPAR